MFDLRPFLADVELPGLPDANQVPPRSMASHLSPAVIALSVLAVGVIAFLLWDFLRQKRDERRERQRLARFREQKLKHAPTERP